MAKRSVQVVILCEDLQQEVFARKYLIERGIHPRKIRSKFAPSGKGAGEQFVRVQYAIEVKTYRQKSAHMELALIVIIDADTHTLKERLDSLDALLDGQQMARRTASEKIAIFVPKRNVETWINFAAGRKVDETTVYSKLQYEGDCSPFVKKLATHICSIGLPPEAPLSLHSACDELQRIL